MLDRDMTDEECDHVLWERTPFPIVMGVDHLAPYLARVRAEDETAEYSALLTRQGDLLTGVANALNGPPPDLTTWSHHDLPEKAQALAERVAVDFTPAELSYVLGGLLDRYEETMRHIASTERMVAGEPCCDKTRGRHERNVETLAAFKEQHAILSSAIAKVRAVEEPAQEDPDA